MFLTTTRALGLGTALPSVDVAVLHDSDWNARADLAALRRARELGSSRLGCPNPTPDDQTPTANGALEQRPALPLLRLVARGSCEERLLALADRKRGLHAALRPTPTRQVSSSYVFIWALLCNPEPALSGVQAECRLVE